MAAGGQEVHPTCQSDSKCQQCVSNWLYITLLV